MPLTRMFMALMDAAVQNKKTKDIAVTVLATGTDADDREVQVNGSYSWTSGDTRVVTLEKSKTANATNTLRFCGVGTTVITVTSTLDAEEGKPKPSKQFLVRVEDKTPCIEEGTINICPNSTEDVTFEVIPVYRTSISGTPSITIPNGNSYEMDRNFIVKREGNVFSLSLRSNSQYNNVSSKTITNLYLEVYIEGEEKPYHVKMPNVVITKKEPKTTIKMTGKINLFFKKEAQTEDVTATLTVPSGYTLDNTVAPTLADLDGEKNKGFADSFEVEPVKEGDNTKLRITQKEATIANNPITGKPVLKGYLCLKYKGYETVKAQITVPTTNTKPSYVLSPASVTANKYAEGLSWDIKLLDKRTKAEIDLSGLTVNANNAKSADIFCYDDSATIDEGKNVIHVAVPEGQSVGKKSVACLTVTGEKWSSSLQYNFTVNSSGTVPKAKLESSTITINTAVYNSNSTKISLNQTDAELTEIPKFTPKGMKGNKLAEAEKIDVTWEQETGRIVAAIRQGQTPAAGTYTYTSTPSIQYYGASYTTPISAVTVKVKIEKKDPVIKLKSTTFSLNTTLAGEGVEAARQSFSWQNLPEEGGFGILPDEEGGELEVSEIYDATKKVTYQSQEDAPIKLSVVKQTEIVKNVETEVPYLVVELRSSGKVLTKTTSFTLKGLTISNGKGQEIAIKDLSIKVKPVTKEPTVTLSKKGSLNVLDPGSGITFTAKIKNISGQIDLDKLEILRETVDEEGNWGVEKESHFKLEKIEVKNANGEVSGYVQNQFRLVRDLEQEGEIENRAYSFRFAISSGGYEFNGQNGVQVDNIKPIQTMPKLKVGTSKLSFFMSAPGLQKVITVAPQKETDAAITDVVWGKKTSDLVKAAFYTPSYDAETGEVTIKIKNPALLKKGSAYDLVLVIACEHQFAETEGTSFTVKVTMK